MDQVQILDSQINADLFGSRSRSTTCIFPMPFHPESPAELCRHAPRPFICVYVRQPSILHRKLLLHKACSVADPGCVSPIPYPGSAFFPSRIPDPGSRIPNLNCHHPGSRIRIKEFKFLTPKKNNKMVSKLKKIWSGLFIPDPDPDADFLPIPDPGVKKGTRSWIRIRNTEGMHKNCYSSLCQ